MIDKIKEYFEEEDEKTVKAALGYDIDEELSDPLGGEIDDAALETGTNSEEISLKAVNKDPVMDGKQVKFGTDPETGDAPDVEDPEPNIDAQTLSMETRMALRDMDKAIKELDDV